MPHWAATTTFAVDNFTRIRVDRRPAEGGFDSGEQRVVKSSNVDERDQVFARLKKAFAGRDSKLRWLKDVPLGVAPAREVPRVVQAARNPLVSMQPYLRGRLRGLDDTWYLTRSRDA